MTAKAPVVKSWTSRQRLFLLLAAVGIVMIGAGWWFWRHTGPTPPEIVLGNLDPEVAEVIGAAQAELSNNRRSAAAWGQLGKLLYAHELHAEALVCFERAQQYDSDEVRWPYYRAVILLPSRPDDAIAALKQAVDCNGEEWIVRLRLAEALLERQQLDEAQRQLALVERHKPGHPQAVLRLGQMALRKDDPRGSIGYLSRAAADTSTRKTANISLAEAWHRLGETAAAAKARRLALELPDDPPWTDPYAEEISNLQVGATGRMFRAQKLLAQGDERAARDLLLETARKYPNFYRVHALLGVRFFMAGELTAAEPWLAETVRMAPDFESARVLLGVVFLMRGNAPEAIKHFRGVLSVHPGSANAHFYLGQALLSQRDIDGAIESFREGLRYRPESPEMHLFLSKALAQKGQQYDSRTHLQNATQLSSTDPRIQALIREIEAGGNPGKAP